MYQRRRSERKAIEKLEVEIGRSHQQLKEEAWYHRWSNRAVFPASSTNADGRLEQLIQRQPQIFDVALLGEIESQQEERQHDQQNGVDQPWQAFKEVMRGPQFQCAVQVLPVAEAQFAVGKEAGVGAVSERKVGGAHRQSQRGLGGSQVQIVDAGDLLVALGGVPMRSLGLNQPAVGEDIRGSAAPDPWMRSREEAAR